MRKLCLDVGMNVDEVDRTRTRCGQNAKVIAFWKKRIECPQSVRVWVISARDIRLCAETRFQRHRGKSVARFGCECPCPDVVRTEGAKLPEALIVEVPSWLFGGDRTRKPGTHGVPHLLCGASLEGRLLSVQPQVVEI